MGPKGIIFFERVDAGGIDGNPPVIYTEWEIYPNVIIRTIVALREMNVLDTTCGPTVIETNGEFWVGKC